MNAIARVAEFLCLGSRVRHQIGFVRTFIQKSDETGGSLVEFSLCLPVLLMLVTGMMSFGIAINNYMTLSNAVEVGARQLAISRGQVTDPCSTISSTISSASPLLKSASLGYTFTINGTAYPGTTCTAGAAQLVQGTAAQIQVTYPCTLSFYGKNLLPGCTLQAQTTELVQ
jgi:Flp pilus assembly protein TadG